SRTTLRAGSTEYARAPASGCVSNGSLVGSDVTDVLLAADRGVAAGLAAEDIVWRRREGARHNGIDGRDQPLPRVGQRFVLLFLGWKERDDTPRSLECEIRSLAKRPVAAKMSVEPLFSHERVHRQLQRGGFLRRPPQLVVDEAKRSIGQQIQSIHFALQADGS